MRADDPASLSPDQRRQEAARILAAGVRRLRSLAAPPVAGPDSAPAQSGDSLQNSLELADETRLTVQDG